MDEQEKQTYLERYHRAKEKGEHFFPDVIFKDAVVALLVFLVLIALAYFVGAPLEERANPADTTYTPRPEWYFLFLFQLLKYFPGELEVIGVVVIPTLVIILLFLLPLLDRSRWRHFLNRPLITAGTMLVVGGVVFLTIRSVQETRPPTDEAMGDQTAALYANNCAGCHGPSIDVPSGSNLHAIIAQGSHEGMPAWTADLDTDQIDALAGFILSPAGSDLFLKNCGTCHEAPSLVAGDPLALNDVLEQGKQFPAHADVEVPEWSEVLSAEERNALLNFLVAPDGQRLFAINCSSCHGRSVAFSDAEGDLRQIISEGGLHLEMPSWQEKLTDSELDRLALYVLDPSAAQSAEGLYDRHCSRCHSDRVPRVDNFARARETIATGGPHETMPVWGDVLTPEQLDALVEYTLAAASGAPVEVGQQLFADNCVTCHGTFGEGGVNPARPGDVIAPISTAEYLSTRDDATLWAIIAQGQPNFGMSPFGSAFGGPLDDDEIDAIIAYVRSWEENPPVELPPELTVDTVALSGQEIYLDICAQCHGISGRGRVGPSLRDAQFRAANTAQDLFDTISEGHEASAMIAWGEVLTAEQIQQLVDFIQQLPVEETVPTPTPQATEEAAANGEPTATAEPEEPEEVSFSTDVMPIFEARCIDCHGTDGGWDASTYEFAMTTGDHGPVIVPGDPEGSLLVQKLLGTHEEGDSMPPPPIRELSSQLIQVIIDWVAAGAPDN